MGHNDAAGLENNVSVPVEICKRNSQDATLITDGTIRLSDGTVTLLLTKSQVRPKSGVQYFGIQVSDLASVKKRLQDGDVAILENGKGQIQLSDPEGNRVALSESGWAS